MPTPDAGLRAPVDVTDGLVTLGPEAVRLRAALDRVFTGWAAAAGAAEVLYPPLIPVADLARFDYFTNFPHLVLAATAVNTDAIADLPTSTTKPQYLWVLVFDYRDERLVKISLPFWLLRMGRRKIDFGNDQGFDLDRLNLDVKELERIGPAMVLDHRATSGERVLIWTQ